MPERPTAYRSPVDEDDISQIEALVARLEVAQNQADPVLFDQRFTVDASFVSASGTRLLGWEEVHEQHRAGLASAPPGTRVRLRILELRFLNHDVAVAHTKQEYLAPETGTNHGTVVLTKRNGSWWICAMQHTNVVQS